MTDAHCKMCTEQLKTIKELEAKIEKTNKIIVEYRNRFFNMQRFYNDEPELTALFNLGAEIILEGK
jgi:hypothetical protein